MNILNLLSQVFEPAARLIDAVHTSEDEKLKAKNGLMVIQASVVSEAIEYETALMNAKRDIIVAEAKSESWLTRNWRPIIMLSLTSAVLAYWFGLTPTDEVTGLSIIPNSIVERMYSLVQIGVGGYLAGRSIEKTAGAITESLKKKDKV